MSCLLFFSGGPGEDLVLGEGAVRMVAQAHGRVDPLEAGAFCSEVELAGGQAAYPWHVAALGPGEFPGGLYLDGSAEQAEKLREGVAGDGVVQRLRRLGSEKQAEAVLARLRGKPPGRLAARRHA